eukprot:CAMPEP_0117518796 /NCGR_PEP_ID=MMETSP0784-20121206/32319_1 /TAXON_ID=39447 /ORGANISM="" /LENGTH=437 /DNA_ID=CAMNT_0005314733 /DNA_START=26 /DNA_END=1339 /DNA_ORIENTATION=-
MALDNDDFSDEITRRGAQIAQLRDVLWDGRERLADAVARNDGLRQNIAKLGIELGIRRAKANGLEDQVALGEAEGEDAARVFVSGAAAAATKVASLRKELADEEEARERAVVVVEQERQRVVALRAEIADANVRLEASRRAAEHAKERLAREEVAEQERLERLVAVSQRHARQSIESATQDLNATIQVYGEALKRSNGLEAEVAVDKERIDGLQTALRHTADRKRRASQDCELLDQSLRMMEAREVSGEYAEMLAVQRQECQTMGQEVADCKRESLMRINGIQGALEETRRMMQDHLDQTQHVPSDPSITVLKASLGEAQAKANTAALQTRSLQKECADLTTNVQILESAAKAADKRKLEALQRRKSLLNEEILTASRILADVKHRERTASEAAERADQSMAATQQLYRDQEMLLRSKLQELWRPLQWQAVQRVEAG